MKGGQLSWVAGRVLAEVEATERNLRGKVEFGHRGGRLISRRKPGIKMMFPKGPP